MNKQTTDKNINISLKDLELIFTDDKQRYNFIKENYIIPPQGYEIVEDSSYIISSNDLITCELSNNWISANKFSKKTINYKFLVFVARKRTIGIGDIVTSMYINERTIVLNKLNDIILTYNILTHELIKGNEKNFIVHEKTNPCIIKWNTDSSNSPFIIAPTKGFLSKHRSPQLWEILHVSDKYGFYVRNDTPIYKYIDYEDARNNYDYSENGRENWSPLYKNQ